MQDAADPMAHRRLQNGTVRDNRNLRHGPVQIICGPLEQALIVNRRFLIMSLRKFIDGMLLPAWNSHVFP